MAYTELEKEAKEIEEKLKPWAGLTFEKASKKGFGKEQEDLQCRLWEIGFLLCRLKGKKERD